MPPLFPPRDARPPDPAASGPAPDAPALAPGLDPAATLATGTLDPTVVVVLGIVRRTFVPLVLLGLLGGLVFVDTAEVTFDDAGDVVSGLASPFVGLALAVVSRLAAAAVGFVAAYPLSHRARLAVDAHPRGRKGAVGRVTDRLYVTRALRSLRWTRAVQQEAVRRLGARGRSLARIDDGVRWSSVPLLGAVVVAAVVRSI